MKATWRCEQLSQVLWHVGKNSAGEVNDLHGSEALPFNKSNQISSDNPLKFHPSLSSKNLEDIIVIAV